MEGVIAALRDGEPGNPAAVREMSALSAASFEAELQTSGGPLFVTFILHDDGTPPDLIVNEANEASAEYPFSPLLSSLPSWSSWTDTTPAAVRALLADVRRAYLEHQVRCIRLLECAPLNFELETLSSDLSPEYSLTRAGADFIVRIIVAAHVADDTGAPVRVGQIGAELVVGAASHLQRSDARIDMDGLSEELIGTPVFPPFSSQVGVASFINESHAAFQTARERVKDNRKRRAAFIASVLATFKRHIVEVDVGMPSKISLLWATTAASYLLTLRLPIAFPDGLPIIALAEFDDGIASSRVIPIDTSSFDKSRSAEVWIQWLKDIMARYCVVAPTHVQ